MNTKLKQAKKLAKGRPDYNPYIGIYSMLPDVSGTNPDARQQYINGHFCYAAKVGILVNGLGIPRHFAFFDYSFRKRHPEVTAPKSDNPDLDKEIADSISLKPVLSDFFKAHPHFSYRTFLGDSAFDSYDTYAMLKNEFGFRRACIPLNERNSRSSSACFDSSGTPVCPVDAVHLSRQIRRQKPFLALQMGLSQVYTSQFPQSVYLRSSLHRLFLWQVCLYLPR